MKYAREGNVHRSACVSVYRYVDVSVSMSAYAFPCLHVSGFSLLSVLDVEFEVALNHASLKSSHHHLISSYHLPVGSGWHVGIALHEIIPV
jgi:hypothetical protein